MGNIKGRALFVLHEGVGSTIFNSQVLEHIKDMKRLGLDIDILCFNTLSKTWETSVRNRDTIYNTEKDINIILKKGINPYMPFSFIINYVLLAWFLLKHKAKYKFIHARADYSAFLSILTKMFHGLPVVWDCRGANVAELEDSLSRQNSLIRFIGRIYLVSFDRFMANINCRYADGAIFVSQALYAMFKEKLKTENFSIIPCPVAETKFYFDENLRTEQRAGFHIDDRQSVFLYSGSMIAYQALGDQYALYEQILKDEKHIVAIITSDVDVAKDYFKALAQERLIITSGRFNEMNGFYNMADFAFLIREPKVLNYVASPTKFGEYCLTGLPVIMNDNVEQAFSNAKEIGNYVFVNDLPAGKVENRARVDIAGKAKLYYSRNSLNKLYTTLYAGIMEAV